MVPPRPRRVPAGPTEGSDTGSARKGGNRPGELELESDTEICPRTLRTLAEQQQLPELLASLGFVLKRPKKHFLKADEAKREAFVTAYAALLIDARQLGAKIFFADEAHFRADADLKGNGYSKESRRW